MVTRQAQQESNQGQGTQSNPTAPLAMAPSAPSSPYVPLSQDIDCTRLVRIEPAKSDEDPIICSVFRVDFCDRPKFNALSYMWGDTKSQYDILIDGVTLKVKQNLRDALRYLRAHAPNTPYWIDAICINQNDITERNRQVRIMHHIYFRAQTVVVWLGKKYADYEASLPHLRTLGFQKSPSEQSKLEVSPDQPLSEFPTAQLPDEKVQERKMVDDICKDGYWNRLWIIQEIGHAENIQVCFGNSALGWARFKHLITTHNKGRDGPMRLIRQREEKYAGSSKFLQLLQDHRDASCQDRRDKVYGLVGLASDARGFVIDYAKSYFEIWTDVMEFLNGHDLFADMDIVYIGGLVKHLLMGPDCPPLRQILQQGTPEKGDNMILGNSKSFQMQAAVLGCVVLVGPHPLEIVGDLNKADKWIQQVQSNYKNDLSRAHEESEMLVRSILVLDDASLSEKCFDYRSIVQWSANEKIYGDGLCRNSSFIRELQKESNGQPKEECSSIKKSPTSQSRLFQISDRWRGETPYKMGLASSDIRSGDLICWLKWPRRAVIVRPEQQHEWNQSDMWKLQVVGTAVVTKDLREPCLNCSQRHDWSENKGKQTLYLDAGTIFVLLA